MAIKPPAIISLSQLWYRQSILHSLPNETLNKSHIILRYYKLQQDWASRHAYRTWNRLQQSHSNHTHGDQHSNTNVNFSSSKSTVPHAVDTCFQRTLEFTSVQITLSVYSQSSVPFSLHKETTILLYFPWNTLHLDIYIIKFIPLTLCNFYFSHQRLAS
jgi:hypothetical protein